MAQIHGVNLGNWLVLEKWMEPCLFSDTRAEDETWLNRLLPPDQLESRMKNHRDSYITEEDFKEIASHGYNLVRLPVPYFLFGDRPPFLGCVEYVDRAFTWASKYHLKILLDLHTAPGSQNGYDNGGILGVCKWHLNPKEVDYVLEVLVRLAKRYGTHPALFGIEPINEPISKRVFHTAPSKNRAMDPKEADGSTFVPSLFLHHFYKKAYFKLREYMPLEKAVIFHDGFRLGEWKDFFLRNHMKNVYLDTHIYIWAMEGFVPFPSQKLYRTYLSMEKKAIRKAQLYTPVLVGEWCLCNHLAVDLPKEGWEEPYYLREEKKIYRSVANLELNAFKEAAGWCYWSWKLDPSSSYEGEDAWKASWDLSHCHAKGWMPKKIPPTTKLQKGR